MQWLEVLKAVAPVVVRVFVPHGDLLAPIVTDAIGHAEQLPHARTGPEKKTIALQLAVDTVNGANVASGRQLLDRSTIEAVDQAIDTAVAVTNVVQKAKDASGPAAAPGV